MESSDYGGGEDVHVDPADPSSEKSAFTDKLDHFLVGDQLGLVHPRVRFEQIFSATSDVAKEEFAKDHFVANDLVPAKNFVKAAGEWLAASEKPDPDRCVH